MTERERGRVAAPRRPPHRWLARSAAVAIGVSVALMTAVGVLGPSPAVVSFPPASPYPPWFLHARPSLLTVSILLWIAVLAGAGGLAAGLLAVRQGWRPRPARLIIGAVLAVTALTVIPPVGSGDMMLYVVSGRITTLGHSPYVMTPAQLKASGDPVGAVAVSAYPGDPTRYGPAATAIEALASAMGGTSVARTVLWLKVWTAAAYLALVFGLDWLLRPETEQRVRAHLLWSLNPLMLWAVMAAGHNDGLAVAAGAGALLVLRRVSGRRALISGILLGLAAAIKLEYALFAVGLAWASRRSPRALAALAAGAAAIVLPGYLLAGPAAISATVSVAASAPYGYVPWFAAAKVLHWQNSTTAIDILGFIAFAALAVILTWRLPTGRSDVPAARLVVAAGLAFLLASPQQRPWYDAMIFPVAGMIIASRLDWIIVGFATASALATVPSYFEVALRRGMLFPALRIGIAGLVPAAITITGIALLWLCASMDWRQTSYPGLAAGGARAERVQQLLSGFDQEQQAESWQLADQWSRPAQLR